MSLTPRIVMVHRLTEFDELIARHGTRQQVGFFLSSRGRSLDDVEARHTAQHEAAAQVLAAIPIDWRRGQVERTDLTRFVFGPEDVIVAVGQDGLVANVAKYLDEQVVIGINPEPARNPGVLVRHAPQRIGELIHVATSAHADRHVEARVMVEALLDDGQSIRALNEIYIGHPSHQSARYQIRTHDGSSERQSSSGIVAGTGTGATGWCRSLWLERTSSMVLPAPEQRALCWFVREAWPSPATGTGCTEGTLGSGEQLLITAESDLVLFGDGMESDPLSLTWGQTARLGLADKRLRLLA